MKAIVVYESLTGTTRSAGHAIADLLTVQGIPTSASPIDAVDAQALSEADLVIVGTWTDGVFVFGQKPARIAKLATLPVIDGKPALVYCTYAIDPGKTLDKLASVVRRRGGKVIGGYAVKRSTVEADVQQLVARLMTQLRLERTSDSPVLAAS